MVENHQFETDQFDEITKPFWILQMIHLVIISIIEHRMQIK